MWAFQTVLAILLFGFNKISYLSIPRVAESPDQYEMFGSAEGSVTLSKIDDFVRQLRTNVRNSLQLSARRRVDVNRIHGIYWRRFLHRRHLLRLRARQRNQSQSECY